MGIEIPESYGGAGASFFHAGARGGGAVACRSVDRRAGRRSNTLVIDALVRWGSSDIKQSVPAEARGKDGWRLLPLRGGVWQRCVALQTRAAETVDGYKISGRKLWITNGNEADLFIVFANLNPDAGYRGITAFLVEPTLQLHGRQEEDKLGIRASSTCELLFEECLVSRDRVLGDVGKGYKVAIETLNEGRIGIARNDRSCPGNARSHYQVHRNASSSENRFLTFRACSSNSRAWRSTSNQPG